MSPVVVAAAALSAALLAPPPQQLQRAYRVVGTGQTSTYGDQGAIAPPKPGQPFYGQDAQHPGPTARYQDNGDGTVTDLNTGLMWVRARGAKVPWGAAVAGAGASRVGGWSDWRVPTIKELYSLINFTGGFHLRATDSTPYLDARVFEFIYGNEARGERGIDCQDWSATPYASRTMGGIPTVFGVNFADGRIKGYPRRFPGGREARMYVRYVRGNPAYGTNDFRDAGDGTISDRATGLTWARADSGKGMNWREALAWVQARNQEQYLGRGDWRLPNAKELQSLVDYARSPDTTDSAAIGPLFESTRITNEGGKPDYPYYWTGTTHLDGPPDRRGAAAVYVAFGRALGWMQFHPGGPPPGVPGPDVAGPGAGRPPRLNGYSSGGPVDSALLDVHGSGAQRSDPKAGSAADFPRGRGPQGDVIRIDNFVRLVRTAP